MAEARFRDALRALERLQRYTDKRGFFVARREMAPFSIIERIIGKLLKRCSVARANNIAVILA